MPRLQSANNAETTILAGVAPADTIFQVADSTNFPDAPFRVSINAEIMEVGVIDRVTHTFSDILRAQEGTTAANHLAGTSIQNRFTAGTYNELATDLDLTATETALNNTINTHTANKDNPHEVTALDVNAYTKTEIDASFYTKTQADANYVKGSGFRIEYLVGVFFTNGLSPIATAAVTFTTPYPSPPIIIPGNITVVVPYSDVILHPFVNVTTTGCTLRIQSISGNLGTLGAPENVLMNFIAIGNV